MSDKKTEVEESSEVRDRPMKSIAKAITWRLIASTTTFFLTLYIFGDDPLAAQKATGVAGAEAVIKMILYFLHERAWNTVRWGKMRVYIRKYNMYRRKVMKRIIINKNATND
jgi:uncharacterized membrane protein